MSAVLFMGPLPPPVHGFSLINAYMHALLLKRAKVFALSRGQLTARDLGAFLRGLLCVRFRIAYVGLSGSYGQLIDCFFIVLLRLFGATVYVHHHSFSYINTSSLFSRFIFFWLRSCNHIALCDRMAAGLCERYGVLPTRVCVLSNACFLPVPELFDNQSADKVLSIGFLSNITEEKGIFDFLEIMRVLTEARLPVRGVIAGPVDPAIQRRFSESLAALPTVEHVGPVYDLEKRRFYEEIDVLLFPTKYVNEAEPVTVLEAMSHGVLVVARVRGCIGSMVDGVGHAFAEADFVDRTIDLLADLARSPSKVVPTAAIREAFARRRAQAEVTLAKLLHEIAGPEPEHD